MIGPKAERISEKATQLAYDIATARDRNTCQRCLRYCGPTARDHRQNRMTGNTVASNLQVLGLACHLWKTEHPHHALADGWAVLRHTDMTPAEWPARRWFVTPYGTKRLGWVLYDDVGGFIEITDQEAQFRRRKAGI